MAEAAKVVLPRLKISPSTLQYYKPRSGPPIFYKERFKLPKETFDKTLGQPWLQAKDPLMPAYPYLGNPNRFPEANQGLYGGATIQSGSKISKGRNKGKTLRKWFPNVKVETMRSQALKQSLTIPVTARVKRTIAKCGGLDQYLLGPKPARIKELGLLGWKLRWHVLNALVAQGRFEDVPYLKGQDQVDRFRARFNETFSDAWNDPKKRAGFIAEQMQTWSELKEKDQRFKKHMETRLLADGAKIPRVAAASKTLDVLSPEMLKLHELTVEEEGPKLSRTMIEQGTAGDEDGSSDRVLVGAETAEEVNDQASIAETLSRSNISEVAVETDKVDLK